MAGTARRHHYIPQVLLRRFTDENGKLFVFDKKRPSIGVRESTPATLFVKRDLYAQTDHAGNRDASVEGAHATLESRVSPIIDKVVHAGRSLTEPRLTPEERACWDRFSFRLWSRTPDARRDVMDESGEYFRGLPKYLENRGPLSAELRAQMTDPAWQRRIMQNAWAQMTVHDGYSVLDTLNSMGIVIASIKRRNKAFVIGNRPIVRIKWSSDPALVDATVGGWLPVSHDVAVKPGGPREREAVISIAVEDIRGINEAILANSDTIAGRSPVLIASLARCTKRS